MTDYPFTDEDRARIDTTVLENLAWNIEQGNVIAQLGTMGPTVLMLREAASYIDHLEGAVEAARAEIWIDADGNRFTNVQLAEISGWVPSVVADNLRERITRLERLLESIAEKCEGDLRNQEPRAMARVIRASLPTSKED